MILKSILIISVVGILISISLFIKSGWNSETGQMDYKKANKNLLYFSILCGFIFLLLPPKSHSKTYRNEYHDFRVEFSVDEAEKSCIVNLYSNKTSPPPTVFTEETIKEARVFLEDWPNVASVTFHTNCGDVNLKKSEVDYLRQPAKKDQMSELGYNLGLYTLISNCSF